MTAELERGLQIAFTARDRRIDLERATCCLLGHLDLALCHRHVGPALSHLEMGPVRRDLDGGLRLPHLKPGDIHRLPEEVEERRLDDAGPSR